MADAERKRERGQQAARSDAPVQAKDAAPVAGARVVGAAPYGVVQAKEPGTKSLLDRGSKPGGLKLFPTMGDMMKMEDERNAPLYAWCAKNKGYVNPIQDPRALLQLVRKGVKEVAGWKDLDLLVAIRTWGNQNGANLPLVDQAITVLTAPKPGTKAGGGSSSLSRAIDKLKKALGDGYNVVDNGGGSLNISTSGVTGKLNNLGGDKTVAQVGPGGASIGKEDRDGSAKLSVNWEGKVGFERKFKNATFSASVDKTTWTIGLSFAMGPDGVDVSQLQGIFTAGVSSLGSMLSSLGPGIRNAADFARVKDAVTKHLDPVKAAVSAASTIANTPKPGTWSVRAGAQVTGPVSPGGGGNKPSWMAGVTLTIWF